MHRSWRGVELVRRGKPDHQDLAATEIRIRRLDPGSAILTVEPIRRAAAERDEGEQLVEEPSIPEITIGRLLDASESTAQTLPEPVTDALETARRWCGERDGSFTINVERNGGPARTAVFDSERIAALASPEVGSAEDEAGEVTAIIGRLSRLNETPDQVLIREPDGTEWTCSFPEEVAAKLGPLWRSTVWARGVGERRSTIRGRFAIERIQAAVPGEQSPLFSLHRVSTAEIAAAQGIGGPQGIEVLSPDEPVDDEIEERYLAALGD